MMRLIAAVCLVALALPLHHRLVEAGPASDEKRGQRDTCHGLVTETPGNNPGNRPYPCPLLNQLRYYATCGCTSQITTYGLSAPDQQALLDWISDAESQLEACDGNINDTVVVQISVSLKLFLEAHASVALAISYVSINDSSGVYWGSVQDIINVAITIQFEIVEPTLELDSNDNCPLIAAMEAAAQQSGDQTMIDECHNATMHIRAVLKMAGFNVTEQLSFIYQILVSECSETTIVFLRSHCSISGFGSFVSMVDVCKVNFQVQQQYTFLAGSSMSDCEILQDLQDIRTATCVTSNANFSSCVTISNIIDQITVVIQSSVDIEVRMEGCANILFSFCKGAPWICPTGMKRGGCSFSDFICMSAFCHNEHCCDCHSPPPPVPPCGCHPGSGESGETGATGSGESGETGVTGSAEVTEVTGSAEVTEVTGSAEVTEETGVTVSESGETTVAASAETTPEASAEATTEAPAETTPEEEEEETTMAASVASSAAPPSSAAPSSAAPSSPAPTTPANTAPTTTSSTQHCEERSVLIVIESSCTCNVIIRSIQVVINTTWTASQRQSLQSTMNAISAAVNGNGTPAQKVAAIWTAINNYKNTQTNQVLVTNFLAITIKRADGTSWGLLSDFLTCTSSCTCSG